VNKKPLKTAGSDFRDKESVKVSSAPFSSSWSNHVVQPKMEGVHESPGGVLSPLKLNGTGLKKGQK